MNLPVHRKFQFVGGSAYLIDNREGANALVVELLLGSGEMKVGGI